MPNTYRMRSLSREQHKEHTEFRCDIRDPKCATDYVNCENSVACTWLSAVLETISEQPNTLVRRIYVCEHNMCTHIIYALVQRTELHAQWKHAHESCTIMIYDGEDYDYENTAHGKLLAVATFCAPHTLYNTNKNNKQLHFIAWLLNCTIICFARRETSGWRKFDVCFGWMMDWMHQRVQHVLICDSYERTNLLV